MDGARSGAFKTTPFALSICLTRAIPLRPAFIGRNERATTSREPSNDRRHEPPTPIRPPPGRLERATANSGGQCNLERDSSGGDRRPVSSCRRHAVAGEHARLQLAAAGLGVTFVTSAFMGYAPDRLVTRTLADLKFTFGLELIWRRGGQNHKTPGSSHMVRQESWSVAIQWSKSASRSVIAQVAEHRFAPNDSRTKIAS